MGFFTAGADGEKSGASKLITPENVNALLNLANTGLDMSRKQSTNNVQNNTPQNDQFNNLLNSLSNQNKPKNDDGSMTTYYLIGGGLLLLIVVIVLIFKFKN